MNFEIIDLNDKQIEDLEKQLDEFDKKYITYRMKGKISIGIVIDDKLIAGVDATMTVYKILYIFTIFVDEEYRFNKIGTLLMKEVEKRAKLLNANMIRLDTFNWQGRDFYLSLGYDEVGSYVNNVEGFSEHFFLKRL